MLENVFAQLLVSYPKKLNHERILQITKKE